MGESIDSVSILFLLHELLGQLELRLALRVLWLLLFLSLRHTCQTEGAKEGLLCLPKLTDPKWERERTNS